MQHFEAHPGAHESYAGECVCLPFYSKQETMEHIISSNFTHRASIQTDTRLFSRGSTICNSPVARCLVPSLKVHQASLNVRSCFLPAFLMSCGLKRNKWEKNRRSMNAVDAFTDPEKLELRYKHVINGILYTFIDKAGDLMWSWNRSRRQDYRNFGAKARPPTNVTSIKTFQRPEIGV